MHGTELKSILIFAISVAATSLAPLAKAQADQVSEEAKRLNEQAGRYAVAGRHVWSTATSAALSNNTSNAPFQAGRVAERTGRAASAAARCDSPAKRPGRREQTQPGGHPGASGRSGRWAIWCCTRSARSPASSGPPARCHTPTAKAWSMVVWRWRKRGGLEGDAGFRVHPSLRSIPSCFSCTQPAGGVPEEELLARGTIRDSLTGAYLRSSAAT
jgi:hypothetical protein